jgi:hypothetical protein
MNSLTLLRAGLASLPQLCFLMAVLPKVSTWFPSQSKRWRGRVGPCIDQYHSHGYLD